MGDAMARMLTPAYDMSGDKRPMHMLEEGDLIEWKRNGERGFSYGRVTCVIPESKRCIRIMPTDKTWNVTGARERWIGRSAVMVVRDRFGFRKEPHDSLGEVFRREAREHHFGPGPNAREPGRGD